MGRLPHCWMVPVSGPTQLRIEIRISPTVQTRRLKLIGPQVTNDWPTWYVWTHFRSQHRWCIASFVHFPVYDAYCSSSECTHCAHHRTLIAMGKIAGMALQHMKTRSSSVSTFEALKRHTVDPGVWFYSRIGFPGPNHCPDSLWYDGFWPSEVRQQAFIVMSVQRVYRASFTTIDTRNARARSTPNLNNRLSVCNVDTFSLKVSLEHLTKRSASRFQAHSASDEGTDRTAVVGVNSVNANSMSLDNRRYRRSFPTCERATRAKRLTGLGA